MTVEELTRELAELRNDMAALRHWLRMTIATMEPAQRRFVFAQMEDLYDTLTDSRLEKSAEAVPAAQAIRHLIDTEEDQVEFYVQQFSR